MSASPAPIRPLVETLPVPREEAEAMVANRPWFHRIAITEDFITPGKAPATGAYPGDRLLDRLGIPPDLTGVRILEIGAWDGAITFPLAKRGADVTGLDIHDPDKTGFNVVSRLTGLKPNYVRGSVYDLEKLFPEPFDIVFFLGVFYHLKDPIRAFEQIGAVTKPGGKVFFEGEGMGTRLDDIDAAMIPQEEADQFAAALATLDKLGVPLTFTYAGKFGGGNNWFIPNKSAVTLWLRNAGFNVLKIGTVEKIGHYGQVQRRISGSAERVTRKVGVEHNVIG